MNKTLRHNNKKEIMNETFISIIGKKVSKISGKPFKSKEKINTVKGTTIHPKLFTVCFTFIEDDSYVEAKKCYLIKEN